MFSLSKIREGLFAAQVMVLWIYLYGNIAFGREDGVLIQVLLLFLLFGGIQILAVIPNLRIRVPLLWLVLLFLSLTVFKHLFDLDDGGVSARSYLYGTSGGMGLFYVIGILANFKSCCHHVISPKLFKILLGFYFCLSAFIFFKTLGDLRPDLLLVRDSDFYQRPGDFVVMVHIMITMFYVSNGLGTRLRGKKSCPWGVFFGSAVYGLSSLTNALTIQMIGSNKAFVIVAILTLLAAAYVLLWDKNKLVRLLHSRLPFLAWIRINFRPLVYFCSFGSLVLLLIWWLGQDWQDILKEITSKIRILNFGDESAANSISARIEIMHQYLSKQLLVAPIFGNANVSKLTTGEEGFFIHSSFFSAWTILGLPGVLIFSALFFMILRAIKRRALFRFQVDCIDEMHFRAVYFFAYIYILAIFLISLIGTHFSWAPLWFSIGFFYPCVYLKPTRS